MTDRREELDPEAEAEEQPVGERDPRYGNLIGTQRDRSRPHEDGYLETDNDTSGSPTGRSDDSDESSD